MLKQQTEDGQVAWQHTPPAKPTTAGRFDKNTIEDILRTAAQLQQAEQDSLSQAEVEAMAAEMGIAPRHVRQAITLSKRNTFGGRISSPLHLSFRQTVIVAVTILLYSFVPASLLTLGQHGLYTMGLDWLFTLTVFILPFVVALLLGFYVRYKRAGAICGGLLMFVMFIEMQIVIQSRRERAMDINSAGLFLLMILMMAVCAGMVCGFGGAALRQWLANRQVSQVPRAFQSADLNR